MKCKSKILDFLNYNYCMINSLMSDEESKFFRGDVVGFIVEDIKKQIKSEQASTDTKQK